MKKILSIALALVMMLAICVPAFATKTITNKAPDAATAIVKTSTLKENGESGENYSVIIPATTLIPWGAESTDLNYTVEAHLGYGKKLAVTVEGNGTMALKEDANEKLAYTLGGAVSYLSERPVVNPADVEVLTFAVAKEAWANAIVGEYSDILTFNATVA